MPEIRRILFPTDFGPHVQSTWPLALMFAEKFDAKLCLMHVLQEPITALPEAGLAIAPPAANLTELLDAARDSLQHLAAKQSARIDSIEVVAGPAAEEIVRYAARIDADLIILSTHGRTGFAHFLLGSVAESVLQRAPCPVLTMRPDSVSGKT